MSDTKPRELPLQELDRVVIRFAGDSGDGMQLTGSRFTESSALWGNDLATLPNFPAEIRAPAGTLAGVSAFQVHISDHDINTPGDAPNVLVAMNPAALKSELNTVIAGGAIIVNIDAFTERNLEKAGYKENPLEDGTLKGYTVYEIPMTSLTKTATEPLGVKPRDAERSKNFFALGVLSWMYTRPVDSTIDWITEKFAKNELVRDANITAFKAGYNFGETAELFETHYVIKPAKLDSGTYTNINGNTALAWGLVAASQLAELPLYLASYPITPASDILHELSNHKNFGVRTLQCEDEIAAVCAAIGASFGGHLAVTTTSGPGLDLKAEAIALATQLELPLIIVDIQRAGPSTGMPTKVEASDLLMARHGRHGDQSIPIVSASRPSDCFFTAIEAARIALTYRTPVILLSDGYLANSSEPWKVPDVSTFEPFPVRFTTEPNATDADGNPTYLPYKRDPETLARDWAIPGADGLMHRIGGLEHEDETGNISYEPANHEIMTKLRDDKVKRIAMQIPDVHVMGDADASLVVVGWGSTWGAITTALDRVRGAGHKVAHVHLRHLNPFNQNLGEVLRSFDTVLVPELNLGQLTTMLRSEYLVDAQVISKVQGLPFTALEIEQHLLKAVA